tara:strand:- start:317 stop:535 length:219 start_codon:yes stop_codon:yes gene_type:complete
MASIIDEIVEELKAKQKRLDKEIINLDKSSVIPQHYNKADDILKLTTDAINCESQADYLDRLSHEIAKKYDQ